MVKIVAVGATVVCVYFYSFLYKMISIMMLAINVTRSLVRWVFLTVFYRSSASSSPNVMSGRNDKNNTSAGKSTTLQVSSPSSYENR